MKGEHEGTEGAAGDRPCPDGDGVLHYWPAHAEDLPEGNPEAACGACGRRWRIHGSLGGFRLKCVCGQWIDVPAGTNPQEPELERREEPTKIGVDEAAEDRPATPSAPDRTSDVAGEPEDGPARESPWLDQGEVREGSLVEASLGERRKWTDRTLLELGALVLAFWLPALVVELTMQGRAKSLALPFAGMAGGALVLLVGLAAGGAAFQAVRRAPARDFLEAILVAFLTVSAGMAWGRLLTGVFEGAADDWLAPLVDELGLAWTLVVIAVLPALFEELAFRGLLQGRLTALLGQRQGLLLTAVAFALAHGLTLGLPIHAALGFYLCWLRARCGSVLPGMATHFLHNAGVVVLTTLHLF